MRTTHQIESDLRVGSYVLLRDYSELPEYRYYVNQWARITEIHSGGRFNTLQFRVFVRWPDGRESAVRLSNILMVETPLQRELRRAAEAWRQPSVPLNQELQGFHVGDEVELIEHTLHPDWRDHVGETGVIEDIYSTAHYCIHIKWADGTFSSAPTSNVRKAQKENKSKSISELHDFRLYVKSKEKI